MDRKQEPLSAYYGKMAFSALAFMKIYRHFRGGTFSDEGRGWTLRVGDADREK